VFRKPTTRSDCNKHIVRREHYTRKNGNWKPKKKFESKEDAENWIKQYKMSGYSAYICKVCGAWHIGKKKIKNNI
jgi:hypothetical protein